MLLQPFLSSLVDAFPPVLLLGAFPQLGSFPCHFFWQLLLHFANGSASCETPSFQKHNAFLYLQNYWQLFGSKTTDFAIADRHVSKKEINPYPKEHAMPKHECSELARLTLRQNDRNFLFDFHILFCAQTHGTQKTWNLTACEPWNSSGPTHLLHIYFCIIYSTTISVHVSSHFYDMQMRSCGRTVSHAVKRRCS